MNKTDESSADFCKNLVKERDLDRYLSTLLAPKERRRALFAVYAFDVAVCNVARHVTEPAIGEMRLQWWRDVLDGIFVDTFDNHPIAEELQLVVHSYDLPKHLFLNIIDAHVFDLYREPMVTQKDLNAYARATSGSIIDLAARILISTDSLEIKFQIERAGVIHGLGKVLRSLPGQVARKQCFLPTQLLVKHDKSSGHVLAADYSTSIGLVLKQIQNTIINELTILRKEQDCLSKQVLPAFFPVSLTDRLINGLFKQGFNPLKQQLQTSQLKMQIFLLKMSLFEQI